MPGGSVSRRDLAPPIGRKIGFTNRTIWSEYGVFAPIWGYVYDHTVYDLADLGDGFPLAGLAEPRIEPEIVFKLHSAPRAGMRPDELLAAIEWVTHGFEIVQSVYPGWKFSAAEATAANALHGALLLGPQRVAPTPSAEWIHDLRSFEIDLLRGEEQIDRGQAANVLDGPLYALLHLIELLASDPHHPPLAAGEIITTGTLTRAFPVAPGERWSTTLHGIDLDGIAVRFR
jgi:2-oxo-3-hexenedioate decarboxylase